MAKPCKHCASIWHASTFCRIAPKKLIEVRKRIPKVGKRELEYREWRDTIAVPFLNENFGHICAEPGCDAVEDLAVDHIQNRGSRADLKMSLENVQWLCPPHHQIKTDREGKYRNDKKSIRQF